MGKIKILAESINQLFENKELDSDIAFLTKDVEPVKAAVAQVFLTRLFKNDPKILKERREELKGVIDSLSASEPKKGEEFLSILEADAGFMNKLLFEVKKIKASSPWTAYSGYGGYGKYTAGVGDIFGSNFGSWTDSYAKRKISGLIDFLKKTNTKDIDLFSRVDDIPPAVQEDVISLINQLKGSGFGEKMIKHSVDSCRFAYTKKDLERFREKISPLLKSIASTEAGLIENLEERNIKNLIDSLNIAVKLDLKDNFIQLFLKLSSKKAANSWLEIVGDVIGEYGHGSEKDVGEAFSELLDEDVIYKVFLEEAKKELLLDSYFLSGFSNLEFGSSSIPMMDAHNKRVLLPRVISEFKFPKKGSLRNNPNLTLYAGLDFHEISHLRYGSYLGINLEEYMKGFDNPALAHNIMNIIEDFRINEAFFREFDSKRPTITKALKGTNRYYLSQNKLQDNKPLQSFLTEFASLLIGGKPLSEFNKSVADYEKEFLKTGVKDKELKKKGIKTYGDAIEHIAKIAQDVQGKTVIHSAEKSDEIYEIIKRIFAEEHEDYKKQASEILGDFNPNAAPPQELQDEMEKTDIKKILEGMKGTDSGKSGEGRNFVNRMEKEAERQAEEMIKKNVSEKIKKAGGFVYGKDKKKLDELGKELEKKALDSYKKGKSPGEIEEELKGEFEKEVDKQFSDWRNRWLKDDYDKAKKMDKEHEKLSKNMAKDIESKLKDDDDYEKLLEEYKKLRQKQEGILAPESLEELKELEKEAEKRQERLKDIIRKRGERMEISRKEKMETEQNKKTINFLGYDTTTGTYSREQKAEIYPYEKKHMEYWNNLDTSTMARVRNILKKLSAEKRKTERQKKYGKLDINELVRKQEDMSSGNISLDEMEKIFMKTRKMERDYAAGVLIDASGSTDEKIATKEKRIIDVEKDAAYILGEATEMLKDKLAIYGFDSEEDGTARMHEIKAFGNKFDDAAKARLGGLVPMDKTPLSIAIRALTGEIYKRKEKSKMMYIITDGSPNAGSDIEDSKMSMEEARRKGIYTVYINIDCAEGEKYFEKLAPSASYSVLLKDVKELPEKLFEIYLKKRKI